MPSNCTITYKNAKINWVVCTYATIGSICFHPRRLIKLIVLKQMKKKLIFVQHDERMGTVLHLHFYNNFIG